MTTTEKFGSRSEQVFIDGRPIGYIAGRDGEPFNMYVGEAATAYKFADRTAALAALESYAVRGSWTGEVSS